MYPCWARDLRSLYRIALSPTHTSTNILLNTIAVLYVCVYVYTCQSACVAMFTCLHFYVVYIPLLVFRRLYNDTGGGIKNAHRATSCCAASSLYFTDRASSAVPRSTWCAWSGVRFWFCELRRVFLVRYLLFDRSVNRRFVVFRSFCVCLFNPFWSRRMYDRYFMFVCIGRFSFLHPNLVQFYLSNSVATIYNRIEIAKIANRSQKSCKSSVK